MDLSLPDHETWYGMLSTFARSTIQGHPFFLGLPAQLERYSQEYRVVKGGALFMDPDYAQSVVNLYIKPFTSAVDKSFRHNCLWNRKFPKAPIARRIGAPSVWATPDNWLSVFDDIVRTSMVCKFIDGPGWLAERLHQCARTQHGLEASFSSRQLDSGYYAYHLYVDFPMKLMKSPKLGGTEDVAVTVEIQFTTQLQEALRAITHEQYAERRLTAEDGLNRHSWKWDYTAEEFRAGYLAHTLHLLEGIIAELRDQQTKGKNMLPREESK